MVKKWLVILVEDEQKARDYLKNILLTRYNDIHIIGEAGTTQDALLLFNKMPIIDGVFIDINLESDGQKAGLNLAFNLNQRENPPWFIFTTAYDYAITAVNDIHPLAYLLKPLDIHQLDAALNYMRKHYVAKSKLMPDIHNFEEHLEIRYTLINSIGNKEKCLCFIKPSDIIYLCKNSNISSIRIKLINGQVLDGISGTLLEWQIKLDQGLFLQIHKSYFINIKQAQSIHPHPFSKETYQLSFKCCTERLTIGEKFYENLVKNLQNIPQ